jgi:5-methylcytosine-specific restriction endonuclease McrA
MAGRDPRLGTVAWRRLRLAVLDRDGWRCQLQGPGCTTVATCVDHVTARADGGDCWDPTNLRAACRPCNGRGGAALANARRRPGYRTGVPQYETRL